MLIEYKFVYNSYYLGEENTKIENKNKNKNANNRKPSIKREALRVDFTKFPGLYYVNIKLIS